MRGGVLILSNIVMDGSGPADSGAAHDETLSLWITVEYAPVPYKAGHPTQDALQNHKRSNGEAQMQK